MTGWGDVDIDQAARVNATEDGDEPLGEAPELTMPRVAGLIERQAQIVKQVAELHMHMYAGDWEYCEHCAVTWPCDTMRIVERVEL